MMAVSADDTPQSIALLSRPHRNRLWWAGVAGVAVLVLVVIPLAAWSISSYQARQKLAAQVVKLRARGEPLTTVELSEYYRSAAGRPEMTTEITAAIALCFAEAANPLAKDLPIVGNAPEPPPPSQPWPELEAVEEYLARQSAALEGIREFARRDGTARFPVDFSGGIGTALPHVQAWRQGARVLSLQFHVGLHRGRTREAADCILDQIGLARALDQEPGLISQLVRLAIVSLAFGNIDTLARQAEIDDASLALLQEGFQKVEYQRCLTQALAGERTFAYMASIAAGAVPSEDDVVLSPDQARQLAELQPRRVRDAAKMLEMSLRIADAADESLAAARRESQRIDTEVQELTQGIVSKRLYALTILMGASNETAVTAFMRSAARRGCVEAALAAERYRRQHGEWPETLRQLVPNYLPAVPIDPFSEQPVKMVVTTAELKVYSVGRDDEDNLGHLSIREEPHTDLGFVIPLTQSRR